MATRQLQGVGVIGLIVACALHTRTSLHTHIRCKDIHINSAHTHKHTQLPKAQAECKALCERFAPTINFQTRTPTIRLAWCWLARTSSPRAAHPPPRSATSSATPTCTWWNGIWRDGNIQWYLCVVNVILVSRYEQIDILFVCERGRMYHTRTMRHFVHPGGS